MHIGHGFVRVAVKPTVDFERITRIERMNVFIPPDTVCATHASELQEGAHIAAEFRCVVFVEDGEPRGALVEMEMEVVEKGVAL